MNQASSDNQTLLAQRDSNSGLPASLTGSGNAIPYEQLAENLTHAAKQTPEPTLKTGSNAIIQASSELLAQMTALRMDGSNVPLDALRESLSNEVRTFENKALSLGANHNDIKAARYILCTALDEALSRGANQIESHLSTSLLSSFHNETDGGEKIFLLIDRLTTNPARYLDLMELAYTCLALGFEGKYRFEKRGAVSLDAVRDSLFRQIQTLRGEVYKDLSPNWEGSKARPNKVTTHIPLSIVALTALLGIGIIFGGFSYVLSRQSDKVISQLSTINQYSRNA